MSVSAADGQTDKTPYHRIIPDGLIHKGASPLFYKWKIGRGKISNDGPSYRAGEAPRASPFGLARLPYILRLEMYQLSSDLEKDF